MPRFSYLFTYFTYFYRLPFLTSSPLSLPYSHIITVSPNVFLSLSPLLPTSLSFFSYFSCISFPPIPFLFISSIPKTFVPILYFPISPTLPSLKLQHPLPSLIYPSMYFFSYSLLFFSHHLFTSHISTATLPSLPINLFLLSLHLSHSLLSPIPFSPLLSPTPFHLFDADTRAPS